MAMNTEITMLWVYCHVDRKQQCHLVKWHCFVVPLGYASGIESSCLI
jgi:hypothetical protein